MKRFALIACALLMSTPAGAAQWSVDYAKSQLGFTVVWAKEPFSAAFTGWKADIDFDPADLAHARAVVTIDPASEKSDEPDFDEGLRGALGFDVKKFPAARFAATRFTHKSGDDYVAEGTLTIRGIERPVTLPFTLTIKGGEAHMVGKAVILRTDFGVGGGPWAKPDPVAHEVTVSIDLLAHRTQ
ncbi:MAG TPA: YceI family protein [Rhizomicrobium sp.]|nr:YceI family protein [Rhizomicrobium sp.]